MDEYQIEKYLYLNKKINELEELIGCLNKEIYQQSLYTQVTYSEDRGIHVTAPRIEKIILDNAIACECIEKRIKRNRTRLKYFESYLSTLSMRERMSLYNGENNQELKERTLDEIHEIETAICLMEQVEPPEEKIQLPNDMMESISIMAAAFIC